MTRRGFVDKLVKKKGQGNYTSSDKERNWQQQRRRRLRYSKSSLPRGNKHNLE